MGLTGKERGNRNGWSHRERLLIFFVQYNSSRRCSRDVNRKSRAEMFDSHVTAGAFPVPS